MQVPENLAPLFDIDHKLVANQAVQVTGLVEDDTLENSSPLFVTREPQPNGVVILKPEKSSACARLRVGVGDFLVLLDANGQQMAKTMDMKTVYIQGYLTGNSKKALGISMQSLFSASSSMSQVPELKVENYQTASPDSATARLLENKLCDELDVAVRTGFLEKVKHLITGRPDLINKKKGKLTFLQEAEFNGKTDVAEFLRQHGGHE